jgi:DNA adenine methylase
MVPSPFIKWVGGKRNLLPQILPHLPQTFGHYHEPFLGGGALFWTLKTPNATLSDSNLDLILAYRAVRDNPQSLIAVLSEMPNTREFFVEVRDNVPSDPLQRAARFIYLNKTAFNGLWRVNKSGKFNVPFGNYKNPSLYDEANLLACSAALQGVGIRHQDFCFIDPKPGDLVYLDPPYVPLKPTSSFTSYTSQGFGVQMQEFLAKKFSDWVEAGAYCVASNSDTSLVRSLYKGHDIHTVVAKRAVSASVAGRGSVTELLVVGRPKT